MKKFGSKNAKAKVKAIRAMKMFHIPRCAYKGANALHWFANLHDVPATVLLRNPYSF